LSALTLRQTWAQDDLQGDSVNRGPGSNCFRHCWSGWGLESTPRQATASDSERTATIQGNQGKPRCQDATLPGGGSFGISLFLSAASIFRLLAVGPDLAAWANLCQDKITIFFGQNGRFSYPITVQIRSS